MSEDQPLSYFEQRQLRKAGMLPPLPTKKEKKPLKKKGEKKIAEERAERERLGGDDSDLVKFYKSAMKRMIGQCMWCGAKTETHIYKYAIYSICHILDKRDTVAPSVKHHPRNWIELCPDHHTMYDKLNWDEKEKLGFWPEIHERLISVYPDLAPSERRFLPDSVRNFIEKNQFPQ